MTRRRAAAFVLSAAAFTWAGACSAPSPPPPWHQETGYRWRDLVVPSGEPGFTAMPASKTGIHFENDVSDSLLLGNRILGQGAGVALGDVDGDGLPDVFLAKTQGCSALYKNLGNWKFEDITKVGGRRRLRPELDRRRVRRRRRQRHARPDPAVDARAECDFPQRRPRTLHRAPRPRPRHDGPRRHDDRDGRRRRRRTPRHVRRELQGVQHRRQHSAAAPPVQPDGAPGRAEQVRGRARFQERLQDRDRGRTWAARA